MTTQEAKQSIREAFQESYVSKIMGKSNFIHINDLSDPLKELLYKLMKTYNLGFVITSLGDWLGEVIQLYALEDETHTALTFDQIISRDVDLDNFLELAKEAVKEVHVDVKPYNPYHGGEYGWLSPLGDFIPAAWGDHNKIALELIRKYWKKEFQDTPDRAGDFVAMKGYCLIHSPSNTGYIVTNLKPLTKKQKEFLFDYFYSIGDTLRAATFMVEEQKILTIVD